MLAPASAAWVRAECRSWCSVAPLVAASKSSAARRYDRRALPLPGSTSPGASGTRAPAIRQEHGAGAPPLEEPGQEAGGSRLPDDDVDSPALATDPRPPVPQVQVVDVQAQDLACACSGLVQYATGSSRAEPRHRWRATHQPRTARALWCGLLDGGAGAGSRSDRHLSSLRQPSSRPLTAEHRGFGCRSLALALPTGRRTKWRSPPSPPGHRGWRRLCRHRAGSSRPEASRRSCAGCLGW